MKKHLKLKKEKPEDFIENVVPQIEQMHKLINSSYTHFARTNSKQHISIAQKLWKLMGDDIYKSKYEGYCVGLREFKTETEVKLNKNMCPDHDKAYQKIEEENYFFKS